MVASVKFKVKTLLRVKMELVVVCPISNVRGDNNKGIEGNRLEVGPYKGRGDMVSDTNQAAGPFIESPAICTCPPNSRITSSVRIST